MYQNSLKTFLLCLLSLVSISAFAYNCEVGGIYYNLNKNNQTAIVTYETTSYNSYSGDIVIPETFESDGTTYRVTSIGNYAFYKCENLSSVKIGENITTIGEHAFSRCSLKEVNIPSNVQSIGDFAFSYSSELENITINEGVEEIGEGVCFSCSSLKEITIPVSVAIMGEQVFRSCGELISATILAPIETLNSDTFQSCKKLTLVTLPESLKSIGSFAFYGCESLEEISIPDGVESIGNYAFQNCIKLSSLPIGDNNSVTEIGACAFEGCTSLKEVVIPDNVKTIGNRAFRECSSLTSVTIGSGVESISYFAFSRCASLESIVVKTDNPHYDSRNGCNAIISKEDGTLVLSCKTTVIPDDVTAIGKYAFYYSSIESATIPDGVKSIGESAFSNCGSLTKLTIGSSVKTIGYGALEGCTGLTSVISKIEVPDQVTFEKDEHMEEGGLFGYEYGFMENEYSDIILYVPIGTVDAYQKSEWGTYFKTIKEVEIESVSIDLPTGYLFSTFSTNVALDFTDNTDVRAYTAKVVGETVELTPIDKVPANTGILIERISENSSTTVSVIDDIAPIEDNNLVAVTKPMSAEALVADNAYILVDDYQFARVLEGASGSLAVGKAYLRGAENGSRSLTIGFGSNNDGTTGLTEKVAEGAEQPIVLYNLNGQRVTKPTKGLYIMNGKKVIIK